MGENEALIQEVERIVGTWSGGILEGTSLCVSFNSREWDKLRTLCSAARSALPVPAPAPVVKVKKGVAVAVDAVAVADVPVDTTVQG